MKSRRLKSLSSTFFCLWLLQFSVTGNLFARISEPRLDTGASESHRDFMHERGLTGPTSHSRYEESPVMAGRILQSNHSYTRAIGKIEHGGNGCTATLTSPPNAEVTTLIFASHCVGGGSPATFTVNGQRIGGFQCFSNRDYARSRSADHDIGVCFSRQRTNTGLYGCITPTARRPIRQADTLRMFGYGNPDNRGERTNNLLSGLTRVTSLRNGGSFVGEGEARVTPGDSGGPVSLEEETRPNLASDHFNFVGVNSMVANHGIVQRLINGILQRHHKVESIFAPFTPGNTAFLNRAIANYTASNPGVTPQICGHNFAPENSNPPQPPTVLPPPRIAQPSQQPMQPTPGEFTPPPIVQPPPPGPSEDFHHQGEELPPPNRTPDQNALVPLRGYTQLQSGLVPGQTTRSLFGKDTQGNSVPIFINRTTGMPHARGGGALSRETLNELKHYYETNELRLTGNALILSQRVRAYLSRQNPPPPQPRPNNPIQPPAPGVLPHTPPPAGRNPIAPPAPPAVPNPRVIQQYERGMFYSTGNARYRFDDVSRHGDPGVFSDIPQGGTGKIIIGHLGAPRPDLQRLIESRGLSDIIELRPMAPNSREAAHARLFGVGALGVDGLGRKISRYQNAEQALSSIIASGEPQLLRSYNAARAALRAPVQPPVAPPPAQPQPPPVPQPPPPRVQTPPSTQRPENFSPMTDEQRRAVAHTLGSRCSSCHGSGSAPAFPAFVTNPEEWARRLQNNDAQARDWLQKFTTKVTNGSMLERAGISRNSHEGEQMLNFLRTLRAEGAPRPQGGTYQGAHIALTDPARQPEYLQVLQSANLPHDVQSDLLGYDVMWDSIGNSPVAWAPTGGDSNRRGARPIRLVEPSSLPRPHLFQRVNGQWRWKEPFDDGFEIDANSRGLKKFVIIRLPRDANGNLIPCVWGKERRPSDELESPWASCPVGTRVYSVLYTTGLGAPRAVDVLMREKRLTPDGRGITWAVDAFRQDSHPNKIREWIARQPDAATNPDFARILQAVNNPQRDAVVSNLGENNSGGRIFNVNGQRTNSIPGSKSVVSGVSMETLQRLYSELPMESAAGTTGWQLEPNGLFSGTHRGIPVNSQTCLNCHQFAGQAFRNVFAAAGLSDRDVYQYGNISGYDTMLSGPMFESRTALADYLRSNRQQIPPMNLRPELAPIFRNYNPENDFRQIYLRSENFRVNNDPKSLRSFPRR